MGERFNPYCDGCTCIGCKVYFNGSAGGGHIAIFYCEPEDAVLYRVQESGARQYLGCLGTGGFEHTVWSAAAACHKEEPEFTFSCDRCGVLLQGTKT